LVLAVATAPHGLVTILTDEASSVPTHFIQWVDY